MSETVFIADVILEAVLFKKCDSAALSRRSLFKRLVLLMCSWLQQFLGLILMSCFICKCPQKSLDAFGGFFYNNRLLVSY